MRSIVLNAFMADERTEGEIKCDQLLLSAVVQIFPSGRVWQVLP